MMQQIIQDGSESFYQAKPEGDPDLITLVRQLLIQNGLEDNVLRYYDTSRFIIQGKDKVSNVQRFLLNRYWNTQLLCCQSPSFEVRYGLIPNGTIEDWLTLFKSKVLPFIVVNRLPIGVHND